MHDLIIPIEFAGSTGVSCGSKAKALAILIGKGITVPRGLCVTTEAYRRALVETGMREKIIMELGRKKFEDMRWEELWDTSLRIRNLFTVSHIPGGMEASLRREIADYFSGTPVAVRSSSLLEDLPGSSCAGLHESFLNLTHADEILHHIVLVWASLWSDAVLSYHRELSLDVDSSLMAVIIQEMVAGEKSGVAFGVNPQNDHQAVVESVYGLNKGLVDGDVEPDRWILDRATGAIISHVAANRSTAVMPARQGVGFQALSPEAALSAPLSLAEVKEVYGLVRQTETIFDAPQDVEWTIKEGKLYALQSRPITSAPKQDANERRAFDLGLRRSFANLKALGERIENELIPALVAEAETLSKKDLRTSSDAELAEEIACRKSVMEKWQGIYWNDFIPFAHGVRLFGQTYNDRLKPSDPYEFVDLLVASGMKSTERNAMLAQLAHKVKENPRLLHEHAEGRGEGFMGELDEFIERFSGHSCSLTQCTDQRSSLIKLLQALSEPSEVPKMRAPKDTEQLGQRYLQAFAPDEQPYAQELLELAKKSYRLRDDDNIYLGRLEAQLVAATEESRRRLGARCKDEYACTNPEEIIRALKFSEYVPSAPDRKPQMLPEAALTARQLRGQPAGAGIGRGRARIIITVSDLFEVKRGEILVCDAIDPNMTFVIPLVAGIVERRGGMLIHGAIIAREYGLPCVTGIPDATRFIKTGDQVIVDGYYGLVIIEKQVNERAAGKTA